MQTERKHGIAVVVGLLPCLAAWVLHIIETSLRAVDTNLFDAFERIGSALYIHGIISLYQGFLLTGMILAAIMAHSIDRKFLKAAGWSFSAAVLSALGLIHAYALTPTGIQNSFGWMAAPEFAAVYVILGLILVGLYYGKLRVLKVD